MPTRFRIPAIKFSSAILCTVAVLTTGSTSLLAQELTGTLYGKVVDATGLPIPGATVTISSPQLIKDSEVRVTNQAGVYRVPVLPPGTYRVQVEMDGFQTVAHSDIALSAGAVLAVDVTLQLSAIAESVTVSGESPLVDVRSAQESSIVDQSFLENTPLGRNFADIISTVPGVVDSGYAYDPAHVVQGSSVRDNQYNLDGANVNDTTVGYMFTEISYDIIEEVQVTTGGVSAEFGQGSGAIFNFVTKSGGDELSGGANAFLQESGLQSTNLSDELLASGLTKPTGVDYIREYGGYLGGPIKEQRVWFFGNLRWFNRALIPPDFPAANPTIDDRQGFVKITSQLTSNTKLTGSYNDRFRDHHPSNASFSTNDSPETWQRSTRDQKVIYLGLTHLFNQDTFLEATFSQTLQHTEAIRSLQEPGYSDIVTGRVYGGWGAVSGPQNNRDGRAIKGTITHFREKWVGGSHNFKAGFERDDLVFLWTRLLPNDFLHVVRNGSPYRVRLYNTPVGQGANTTRHAAFVQDSWTLGDRLTLNLGVRFESSEAWHPEQEGGGNQWFPLQHFEERRDVINWFSTSPRFGLVWDLEGDRRTAFKVSYARYYESMINQHGLSANKNSAAFQEYDWMDRNGDGVFQNGEQGTLRQDIRANLDQVDPNLRQPYTDAIQVGIDRQLRANFAVSVTGTYKRGRDIIENIDISRPFSAYDPLTVTNPLDGQPMTIFALNPSFQGVQRVRLLTNPNDPVPLKRDYWGVQIVANKRMRERWQFQGALTLSRSRGNVGNSFGQTFGGTAIYDTPNSLINAYGPLDLDTPVELKLQGTYLAPYGISLSAYYSGMSGFPLWEPADFPTNIAGAYTVRFTSADNPAIVVEPFIDVTGEPRGTRRVDFRNLVSIRGEKQFQVGRTRLDLLVDAFNLLNINTVIYVQSLQYEHPSFLKPARIVDPRNLRLAIQLSF